MTAPGERLPGSGVASTTISTLRPDGGQYEPK